MYEGINFFKQTDRIKEHNLKSKTFNNSCIVGKKNNKQISNLICSFFINFLNVSIVCLVNSTTVLTNRYRRLLHFLLLHSSSTDVWQAHFNIFKCFSGAGLKSVNIGWYSPSTNGQPTNTRIHVSLELDKHFAATMFLWKVN